MQEKQGVFRLRHGGPPSSCRAAGCFPGRADGWSLFGRNVSGRGAGPARPRGTRADGTYIMLKILIIYTWASKTTSPRQDFLTFRVIFFTKTFSTTY